jgi:hypothetical protein
MMVLGSCTSGPNYTLESSLGTYLRQREVGSSNTQLGTVFVIKLREDNNPTKQTVNFTITGPTGFASIKESYAAGSDWVIVPAPDATPLVGQYRIELSSGLTQTLELQDASQTLALATIITTLENGTVNVSWTSVAGAVGYYVRLFNTANGSRVAPTVYTLSTQTLFQNVTQGSFAVAVYAANFDTVTDNPPLPARVNVSDSIGVVVQGGSGFVAKSSNVYRTYMIAKTTHGERDLPASAVIPLR